MPGQGQLSVAFEAFKILLAFVCPFKWHPLANQLIQGGSLAGIIRDKALIVCSQAKEGPYLFLCAGVGQSRTRAILSGCVCMPEAEMTWPKNSIWPQNRVHFLGLRVRPVLASLANNRSRRSRTWDTVVPYTVTSSIYRTRPWPIRSRKRVSIRRSNVAGALQSPYGITRNSNRPLSVAKAVMGWEAGLRATCQNPDARSTEQYQILPPKASRQSSIWGMG